MLAPNPDVSEIRLIDQTRSSALALRALAVSSGGVVLILGLVLLVVTIRAHQHSATAVLITPSPSAVDADLIRNHCVKEVIRAKASDPTDSVRQKSLRDSLRIDLDEHADRIEVTVSWRDAGDAELLAEELARAFVEERNRAEKIALLKRLRRPTLGECEALEQSASSARREAIRWLVEHHSSVLPATLLRLMETDDPLASASIAASSKLLSAAGQADFDTLQYASFKPPMGAGTRESPFSILARTPVTTPVLNDPERVFQLSSTQGYDRVTLQLPSFKRLMPSGPGPATWSHRTDSERMLDAPVKHLTAEVEAIRHRLEEEVLAVAAKEDVATDAEFGALLNTAALKSEQAKAIRKGVQAGSPLSKPVASFISVTSVHPGTRWWQALAALPHSVLICLFVGINLLVFGLFGCPGLSRRLAMAPETKLDDDRQRQLLAGREEPEPW